MNSVMFQGSEIIAWISSQLGSGLLGYGPRYYQWVPRLRGSLAVSWNHRRGAAFITGSDLLEGLASEISLLGKCRVIKIISSDCRVLQHKEPAGAF